MAAARDAAAMPDLQRALAGWREHDAKRALHAVDREVIRSTDAARALVLELLARPLPSRDLYNACARLGRLLAEAGASPSLAVSTVDSAIRALAELGFEVDGDRVPSACGSVAEGYFAVVVEAERALARRSWEYPACAVKVSKTTVAIACGNPSDEADALGDWAARVALAASRDGYREALLSGDEAPRTEITQALGLMGIKVVDSVEPPSKAGWFSSLLKK